DHNYGFKFFMQWDASTIFPIDEGELWLSPEGALTYQPLPDVSGTFELEIWLCDIYTTSEDCLETPEADIWYPLTITVLPVNDAPSFNVAAEDLTLSVTED